MKVLLFILSFVLTFANQQALIQLNWKYQFEFAGFIMAKEKGFYKDLGLNVKLNELQNNIDVVKLVLKTKNSYGVGDSSLILDLMNGEKIKLLMPIYEKSPFVLTAVNMKLNSLKEIEKYNIILDQFAIKNPAILAMLKSQNVEIEKLNIKKENFYNDIYKKNIYAFYESNELYTLKKHKIPYTIFDPKDYGFDFYGDILFTSSSTNTELNKKIVEATKKGYEYAFSHIDETIDIILKKYNTQNLSKEKLLYEAHELKKYLTKTYKFDRRKIKNIKSIYSLLGIKNLNYVYLNLHLTKKEINFLETHQIRAISTATWEPFNILKNSKLEGIAIDYAKYIQDKLHIKFLCFIASDWHQVLEGIKNKKYDLTCSTTKTKDREKYALFSKPYASFPIVVATRNDVGFISNLNLIKNKKIAVGKDFTAEKLLKKFYPKIELIEVKNTNEALKLVNEGKVFGAADILPVIAYKINKYSYANLKIALKTDVMFNVRFMVRNDYPELVSIINKIINSMSEKDKEKIYSKWISVNYQDGYSDKYINKIFWAITIISILVIGVIFYLIENIKKREEIEEKLETLATRDKLTSIFNRYKIDMTLSEQIEIAKRYKRDLSIIFFDIDHFKRVNDTFGHKMGDYVLIELAKLVSSHIRSSDIFGRWGGEEFLIILPETDLEEAYLVAQKLRKIIENHKFKIVGQITCSFGVVQYKNEKNVSELMEKVDKLLYLSKKNGRNQVTKG